MARPALSLKAHALRLLAQREHSRAELRRKLVARVDAADAGEPCEAPGACVDKLLDWLEAHRYLSEQRFVESRVHARAGRFGNLRIRQELAQHGLQLDAPTQQALQQSELERARGVWRRKFGPAPGTAAADRAKQGRFLAGRGFSADIVHRVLRSGDDD